MTQSIKKIPWCSALDLAEKVAMNYDGDWSFLHSGINEETKSSKSIIALFAKSKLELDDLSQLKRFLSKDSDDYENAYFGWVSYEYKDNLESFKREKKSFIPLPKIYFANFALVFEFDHEQEILTAFFDKKSYLDEVLNYQAKDLPCPNIETKDLQSNFCNKRYLEAIEEIKKMIADGDFYQTNLTRKFFGEFNLTEPFEFFTLFKQLHKISPANFSSFLRSDENFVISSSPELFLRSFDKNLVSRPIKGTAPRSKNRVEDEKNKNYLLNSQKEKAENLMIVDLVRNDLSRVCKPSSIKVDNLFKVNSYKTLHHLSSEVRGAIEEGFDAVDAFKAAFPPGSMTGAPKISAIRAAQNFEEVNRGIYSGAIGYFKSLDEMVFSVVIRTLIAKKDKFEFQVGGAITFDSDAKMELEETFVKAKGICKILNIKL